METLVGIAAFVGILGVVYWMFRPWERRRKDMERSKSWPTTEARVIAASPRTFTARGLANWWVADVYEVDGSNFYGRMTYVLQQPIVSEISTIYPEGSQITVRYNP